MQIETESRGQQHLPESKQILQKSIKKDKEGHYIVIQGSIQEEDITLVNIYTLNTGALSANFGFFPSFSSCSQVESQVVYSMSFLFPKVGLYCNKPPSQHCFQCVPWVLSCRVSLSLVSRFILTFFISSVFLWLFRNV